MSRSLPFSEACRRNRGPIGQTLVQLLPDEAEVLEIGSGTGQHAVFFSALKPNWQWQCSDLAENLSGIAARVQLEGNGRLADPLELDVMGDHWPPGPFDAVFTANTLHIMPWDHTPVLLQRSAAVLRPGGSLMIYGPFHDDGVHTAPSNEAFDRSLKSRDPLMGVRDAHTIKALASDSGLEAAADLAMPANNRFLIFRKTDAAPM